MNCEKFHSNIAAFLAGELDERSSDQLRQHAEECSKCAAEIKSAAVIVDMLKAHPDKDVPESVEAHVLSSLESLRAKRRQPMPSPVPLLSRIQGALTMKRSLIAAGLMAAVIAVGLGVLPGLKTGHALAQVANAMSNVKTIHMVIKKAHPKTGEPFTEELWIKLPSHYRLKSNYADVADDGQKKILVQTSNGVTTTTISPSEGLKGLDPSDSYLVLFNFRELVKEFGDKVLSRTSTTLVDGRKATVFSFRDCRFIVDDATDLPARLESYSSDGKLRKVLDHIEYDVEIPDSIFKLEIPEDAVVIDTTKPPSFSWEVEKQRMVTAAKLEASGAWKLAWRVGVPIYSIYDQNSGSVGSPAHPGMRFRPMDTGKAWLFYIPKKNSYFVLGRWVVTDGKTPGYNLVVQDLEFPAPRKAQILKHRPSRVIMTDAKPGLYDPWTGLQNLGPGTLTIIEKHRWNRGGLYYEIKGRAKHIPDGKVYTNETASFNELVNCVPPTDAPYPANLYWGNMSAKEIRNRKLQIDFHNKVAAFLSSKNARGCPVYEGAEIQEIGLLDDNVPLCDGKFQFYRLHWKDYAPDGHTDGDWAKGLGYVLKVPDKRIFLCIGHVKVKYPWRKERICTDSIITYDGEILPLER